MSLGLLLRLIFCIFTLGLLVYNCIDQQNKITLLKMQVPVLSKEVNAIKEKNACLHFEVGQFENPKYLFKMLHNKDYSHLKYPLEKDVKVIKIKELDETDR